VLMAIPTATIAIDRTVNAGDRRSERTACRMASLDHVALAAGSAGHHKPF
jgi:hypothetical protein